jgi:hypothetical protein
VNATTLVRYRQRDTTVPAFKADLTTTKMSPWSAIGESYYIVGAVRAAAGQVTVSSLHYHPLDPAPAEITAGFTDSDQFEFIEFMNISAQRINLEGCRISAGADFTFHVAAPVELAPGEKVLVVKNTAAFTSRYGAAAAARVIGEFEGNDNLNNSGEIITLLASDGVTPILSFTYDDEPLWPVEADGDGPALVLIAPQSNPDLSNPLNWRASTSAGGTPVTGDQMAYTAWKTANGVANENDDIDGDGLLPIAEYALGTSPTAASGASLPLITVQPDGSLLVQFTRALTADDAVYAVQLSENLNGWSSASTAVVSRTFGPGTETLTLAIPASSGNRRFVRLLFNLR